MRYTILDFQRDFSDDNVCLDYIFNQRYGKDYACPSCKKVGKFYRIRKRKVYHCAFCGHQIAPTAGTIFHKSSTSLVKWFFAIFLMSQAKNGVAAKELQRHLGVTYKCAWRMGKQIRLLMQQGDDMLCGTVETDETYIGGYRKGGHGGKDKTPVFGMVKRGGDVRAEKINARHTHIILRSILKNVKRGTNIMSDQFSAYHKTARLGFNHLAVNHWRKEFVRGDVHTNTIEGFWSQMKRSLNGTYHSVSPKHLQAYIDQFAFYYNNRTSRTPLFHLLMGQVCRRG